MATSAPRKKAPTHAQEADNKEKADRKRLKSIPGGKGQPEPGGLESLLGGKVTRAANRPRKGRKKQRPSETLPRDLRKYSDLYAAAKTLEREISFKLRYAQGRIKDHCLHELARLYVLTGTRETSVQYTADHSRFTFIQTSRTFLDHEKVEALRKLNLAIDEQTELKGLRVDYEAIRRHGLESRLREALAGMGLPSDVLEECIVPDVQLKESFYQILDNVVRDSLKEGETLEDKIYDVIRILNPGTQIRNVEAVDMNPQQCLDLVIRTPITLTEDEESDDLWQE